MAVINRSPHWTYDEFIQRGTEIHNGKYDYSLIDPNSTIKHNTKVQIKCVTCEHVFYKSVTNHIRLKSGCPACSKRIPWTPARFIEKAIEIHSDKYDYSLIDPNSIIKCTTKVSIKCNTCGYIFNQMIQNHIRHKRGCTACNNRLPWNYDKVIKKAVEIHGDKYDYGLIDPDNTITALTNIPIKCNTCEYIFNQTVTNHIHHKNGCPACGKQLVYTYDRFIEKAIEIHGDKYDYSLIDPSSKINTRTKVSIKCRKCEYVFIQRVSSHINNKNGCANCAKIIPLDLQKFILRATRIHGNKYDYSLIDPNSKIRIATKVPIKCKKCGCIFEQQIDSHINKMNGCPSCAGVLKWTLLEFIRYATYLHRSRYDYSLIDTNSKIRSGTRVSIKCKTCNHIFKPTVQSHIHNKTGCPECLFPAN